MLTYCWRFSAAALTYLLLTGSVTATEVDGAALASESLGDQWLSHGRNYSEQRFSPLKDIDQHSVKRLGLVWALDLPEAHSLQATPLAVDGVLYFTTSWAVVHAVDARSGKVLWTYDPEVRQAFSKNPKRMRIMWGTHRGVAFWKGRVYLGTHDGRLLALSAKTGKLIWSVQTFDELSARYITGAPRVFNGKVIIGHSAGDNGPARGYVTAYDALTGRQIWRFYTVPGDPAHGFENKTMEMAAATWKGEWWKFGGAGGAVWDSMTYDPDLNRVYLGVGNAAPWNRRLRGEGDSLFVASIVALDADTGEYLWHYQETPGDAWDYDATQNMVLTTLTVNGQPRKVLMQASKNGFFYVLDRVTGRFLWADPIDKVTWASSIDPVSGRPVESPDALYHDSHATVWPSPNGVHGWQPMSYDPGRHFAFVPIQSGAGHYNDEGLDPKTWRPPEFGISFGLSLSRLADIPADASKAALLAWDPVGRREVWRVWLPGGWPAGTLATAGGLVFIGNAAGQFAAYASESGARLWGFDAQRGIVAPPISYRVGGRQFISVLADFSGAAAQIGGSLAAQHGWTYRGGGRRLLTFALDGAARLPETTQPPVVPLDVAAYQVDPALAERGNGLFIENCIQCHGVNVVSGGAAPDLRASPLAADLGSLEQVVRGGALTRSGMPQFQDVSHEDVEALYAYIRARARDSLAAERSGAREPAK